MTTINETCACGATFRITSHYSSDAKHAADDWREGHKHAESVGICGHRPPPLMLDGLELMRPHCVLKAGHAGMHGDDNGGHWTEVPQNGPETAPGAPSSTSRDSQGGDDETRRA